MTALNLALAVIGGLILVIGLFSEPLKRSLLSATILALLVGILLGPSVFGLLDLSEWGKPEAILEQASRLTIAIGLMGVALRLPSGYVLSRWRSLLVLLGPVMLLMWLSSGLLAYLILGLPFWVAMLVGAVVTPTDPVIASTIVTGEVAEQNLPARVRNLLSSCPGSRERTTGWHTRSCSWPYSCRRIRRRRRWCDG